MLMKDGDKLNQLQEDLYLYIRVSLLTLTVGKKTMPSVFIINICFWLFLSNKLKRWTNYVL